MLILLRLNKFDSLATHPWLCRVYKRLTKEERELARAFIREQGEASPAVFEHKVNRIFLDREKPKHFPEIMELLSICSRV